MKALKFMHRRGGEGKGVRKNENSREGTLRNFSSSFRFNGKGLEASSNEHHVNILALEWSVTNSFVLTDTGRAYDSDTPLLIIKITNYILATLGLSNPNNKLRPRCLILSLWAKQNHRVALGYDPVRYFQNRHLIRMRHKLPTSPCFRS